MSLSDHRYTARIAPSSPTAVDAIHAGVVIIDERGQRVTESIASGGLIWPTKPIPVLIDHEERFPVGFISDVAERDGWHEATFVLDLDKPLADVAQELLRIGTPVSIGAKSLLKDTSLADLGLATPVTRHTTAVLQEVSILSPGVTPAYAAAKVTRITERGTARDRMREREQERERAQAKPEPPKPAAAHPPSPRPAPPVVLIRTSKAQRDAIETAELQRRHDWLLDHGYRADFEDVLDNLKQEVGYGRDLSRECRRHRTVA